MSKEPAPTSDPSDQGKGDYVYRLDIPKLLEKTSARGDSTGYKIYRRAGISESAAYRILSGESQPDLNTAMRLAEAYDFDLRDVIKRIPIEAAA